jgi:hypothetical protein
MIKIIAKKKRVEYKALLLIKLLFLLFIKLDKPKTARIGMHNSNIT